MQMAIPMKKQVNRTRRGALFLGLIAGVSLVCAASCSPSDDARGGGRVEHPRDPGPPAPPPPTSVVLPLASAPVPLTPVTTPPSVELPLSYSEKFEQRSGIKLSPLDKTILDECPERAWTQNVPNRLCKYDSECGDGFCDRGRCAGKRTCSSDYGRRCEKQDDCSFLPCIKGRCRSCVSEAECDWKRGRLGESNVKCRRDFFNAGARECMGSIASIPPEVYRR
jgi:hypothetical protein